MKKKKARPIDLSLLEINRDALWNSLSAESDRGCALIAAAHLDAALGVLLNQFFATPAPEEFFKGSGPLATFSSRIDLSFCLGLIPTYIRRDLDLIRSIRNEFAHELDLEINFESASIAARINESHFAKLVGFKGKKTRVLISVDGDLTNGKVLSTKDFFLWSVSSTMGTIHDSSLKTHRLISHEVWFKSHEDLFEQ